MKRVVPGAELAALVSAVAEAKAPRSAINAALPTATLLPSITPVIPFPGMLANSLGCESDNFCFSAAATIAPANGCSLARSRLAARRKGFTIVILEERFQSVAVCLR